MKVFEASTKKQALGAGQSCAKRGKRKAVAQQSNEKPGRTTSRSFSPLKQFKRIEVIEVVPTKSLANNTYMRSAHSSGRGVESSIREKSEKLSLGPMFALPPLFLSLGKQFKMAASKSGKTQQASLTT